MIKRNFNLKEYLTAGVENVIRDILKTTAKNPKESAFMAKFAMRAKASAAVREKNSFMPPFLIASITSICNMRCKGCYVRGIGSCNDEPDGEMMTADEWRDVFRQAKESMKRCSRA